MTFYCCALMLVSSSDVELSTWCCAACCLLSLSCLQLWTTFPLEALSHRRRRVLVSQWQCAFGVDRSRLNVKTQETARISFVCQFRLLATQSATSGPSSRSTRSWGCRKWTCARTRSARQSVGMVEDIIQRRLMHSSEANGTL